jgi:hypothetical protein
MLIVMLLESTTVLEPGPDPDCLPRPSVRIEDFALVEDYLCAYLDDPAFACRYPGAHESWTRTWRMLRRADSAARVLCAAHLARDTMWRFACALGEFHAPGTPAPLPSEFLMCARELIDIYRLQLGDERCGLLGTLVDDWQALYDVVQRHERPAPDAPERLRWEDGRRLALLTALVMVEIDRSI